MESDYTKYIYELLELYKYKHMFSINIIPYISTYMTLLMLLKIFNLSVKISIYWVL